MAVNIMLLFTTLKEHAGNALIRLADKRHNYYTHIFTALRSFTSKAKANE
jgi:hypothetical protein